MKSLSELRPTLRANSRLSSAAILTVAAALTATAINVLIRAGLARELGPEPTGVYVLVIVTINLVVFGVGMGLPVFNGCFAQKKPLGLLLVNSALWSGISLAGLGLLWVGLGVVQSLGYDVSYPAYFGLVVLLAPVGLLVESCRGLLQGLERMKAFNVVLLSSVLGNAIVLVVALYGLRWGVTGALVAWGVGLGTALGVGLAFLSRQEGVRLAWNSSILRQSLAFGGQVWASQLVGLLNFRLALFLIGVFLGAESVGYYAIAMAVAELLYLIPAAVGSTLLPRLAVSSGPDAARLVAAGCRHTLYLGLMMALVLALSGRFLITSIFTSSFEPSVLPLVLLLPGVVAYSLGHITTPYFNAHIGRPIVNAALATLSLVAQSALIILLVPSLGLPGVALGTSIGYIVGISATFVVLRRVSGIGWADALLLRKDDLQTYKLYLSSFRLRVARAGVDGDRG